MEYIASSTDLGNHNVDIGLVKFSTHAEYLGQFKPVSLEDPTAINDELYNTLMTFRSGGYTHFDDALDEVIRYYGEAPANRTNLLFFLSDGIPNVPGDGDNEEPLVQYKNNQASALQYDSELAILDGYDVHRMSIGVGSGSDVRPGYGLDMIDNTPDDVTGEKAIKVTTTDALTDALLSNPLVGSIVDLDVDVNGMDQPAIDLSVVTSGPTGFAFGTFIVNGLNPTDGYINKVSASITVDYDGNIETTGDQVILSTTNEVVGSLM
uniref:VWFA domain-containing protein n=1 Tax=Grammatophora oceanica TaxID=210454 RepID=A0A7S1VHX6_9STRA|mmetsp:Transcript_47028/g.69938  ORF Transcript_47028/g.69938 Transcript_47028/m.69938 type:complete len:265 (+) Transcript_47028:695-1489(+)